ncbi:MAG: ATP-binding protein [Candidatus Izimaplasma sp.]|nr:ATP-binding protein [Candidatus Izimaplasma bacterium]
MLMQFSVKNYKGFKDEILLDFTKTKEYQFNKHAIKDGMINTAVIYGKNATGKTNLGLAIFDLTLYLTDKERIPHQKTLLHNALSVEKYTTFKYIFQLKDNIVKYTYLKDNKSNLYKEEFFVNDEKIFTYNFQSRKIDKGNLGLIKANKLDFDLRDSNISIVRYIASNSGAPKDNVIMQFMQYVDNMLWFRSVENNSYIGFSKGGESIVQKIVDNGLTTKFEKFLKNADIDFNLVIKKDLTGHNILMVDFGNNQFLPFWNIASSGTRALSLYFYWSINFDKISFLFVDEFDAFYHYELAQMIIKQVAKKVNVQAIFTTHNTTLLSNNILRPDCFFVISNNKIDSLPYLTEREIREGHNIEKLYRQREFYEE